jgi:L-gulonate 5-dehydrogenase
MKVAVFAGPHEIRLEEAPRPKPGPGEAVLKMRACGVCGGDIPFYTGVPDYCCKHPWVLGHEIAGVVDELGGDAGGLRVGSRVAVEPLIGCGSCYACRIGKYNCCANLRIIGAHTPGGFADYVLVPMNRCHVVPDTLPFDVAALCEPYSIGANVVQRGAVTAADTVVVNGAGNVGLAVLDFAKNVHGARVMVTDVFPARLQRARGLGADVVVNAREEDVLRRVLDFSGGDGASVVVDATGDSEVTENTVHMVAHGGRIVVVGISENNVAIHGVNIIKKEMTLLGSRNSANIFPAVIEGVASGRLHPEKLITHRFPFADIGRAFAFAARNVGQIGKVVIEFPA